MGPIAIYHAVMMVLSSLMLALSLLQRCWAWRLNRLAKQQGESYVFSHSRFCDVIDFYHRHLVCHHTVVVLRVPGRARMVAARQNTPLFAIVNPLLIVSYACILIMNIITLYNDEGDGETISIVRTFFTATNSHEFPSLILLGSHAFKFC